MSGFDKANLRSANRFINNTSNTGNDITAVSPYIATVIDFNPVKAMFLSTNIPIQSQSSGGGTNIIERIHVQPNDAVIYKENEQTHAVDIVGRNILDKLTFKLCDSHGNVINLEGQHLSFSLIIKG